MMKKLIFMWMLVFSCVFCMAQTPFDTIQTQQQEASDALIDFEPDTVLSLDGDTVLVPLSDTTLTLEYDTIEYGMVEAPFRSVSYYPVDFSFAFGISAYMGEYDRDATFQDWWTFPALNFSVSYWLTHCFGIGADVVFNKCRGLSIAGDDRATFGGSDALYGDGYFVQVTGSYMGFAANGYFDMSRLLTLGAMDTYRLVAFLGAGGVFTVKSEHRKAGFMVHTGIRNHWILNTHWDFDANIHLSFISDKFDGEHGPMSEHNIPFDIVPCVTLGLTYKLW